MHRTHYYQNSSSSDDYDDALLFSKSTSFDILAANLTNEQEARIKHFDEKSQFQTKDIRKIIERVLPENVVITNPIISYIAQSAHLFAAELVETARKISQNTDPLTPDLILLAFNQLEYEGKIPGKRVTNHSMK